MKLKFSVLSSIKTKILFGLTLFVLGFSAVMTVVVYRFMVDTIREDRMREVGEAANTRYRLLINDLEYRQEMALGLLHRAAKTCMRHHVNRRSGTQWELDDECVYNLEETLMESSDTIGIVIETFDNSKHWIMGNIDSNNVDQLDFQHGKLLAVFSARTVDNEGQPFYVQSSDSIIQLKATVGYSLSVIEKIFSQNPELGRTGESFLTDNLGHFITGPRYLQALQKLQSQAATPPSRSIPHFLSLDPILRKHEKRDVATKGFNSTALDFCLSGKNSERLGIDYREAKVIHGFRSVPEIDGGCVMAHIEQSEVFASLAQLKSDIIGIVLIFSGVALLLIYFFTNLILDPLDYLARIARRISDGHFSDRSHLDRNDEVGCLSDSFNRMTDILTETQSNFTLAIESLKDYSITLLDKEGRILFWNKGIKKVFRLEEKDCVGRYFSCYFTEEDQKKCLPQRKLELALKYRTVEMEGERLRGDGTTFLSLTQCSAIFDENRNHKGFILVTRDVTERRRLEASAIEAQRASSQKSSFLASMSHEIRTPLNSILGVIQVLRDRLKGEEETRLLNVAGGAGEALLTVINDVLDISKIEAGEVRLEATPFNLRDQITMCRDIMKIRARDKRIEIETEIDDQIQGLYLADPARLRQILLNLIGNAIKFSEKGVISVVAQIKRIDNQNGLSLIEFSVTDQGIGVAPHLQSVIFDRFKQADESITRRFGGTGLGLSICKNLVELMNGEIGLQSEVGKGSRFYFTLELKQIPSQAALASAPGAVFGGCDYQSLVSGDYFRSLLKELQREQFRILIADDAPDNKLIFRSFLKGLPFEIIDVSDGEQAIAAFKKGPFDLVFMDVQMPVLDGYSATREIRKWERQQALVNENRSNKRSSLPASPGRWSPRKKIPIIALTANALDEDIRMSFSMGCSDHLCKPIRKEKLLRLLESHLPRLCSTNPPTPMVPRFSDADKLNPGEASV